MPLLWPGGPVAIFEYALLMRPHQMWSPLGLMHTRRSTAIAGLLAVASGIGVVAPATNPALADQPIGIITTAVGTVGDGGPASAAYLESRYMSLDAAGNVYLAEYHAIRKIAAVTNVVTTVAGNGAPRYSGNGSQAFSTGMTPSYALARPNGDLYISDGSSARVLKVTAATGVVTTVAGNGTPGSAGDGGQATAAQLFYPGGLAFDSVGNLYIADVFGARVRRVATNGVITTFAGTGTGGFNSDNQPATTAQLTFPIMLTIDPSNNVYIADAGNHRIRRVAAGTGIITTVVGTGVAGYNGDGVGKQASCTSPTT